jgi:hypothetical protein
VTQNKIEALGKSLIGLFANLRTADRAARGLIALDLREDQLEIDMILEWSKNSPLSSPPNSGLTACMVPNAPREAVHKV